MIKIKLYCLFLGLSFFLTCSYKIHWKKYSFNEFSLSVPDDYNAMPKDSSNDNGRTWIAILNSKNEQSELRISKIVKYDSSNSLDKFANNYISKLRRIYGASISSLSWSKVLLSKKEYLKIKYNVEGVEDSTLKRKTIYLTTNYIHINDGAVFFFTFVSKLINPNNTNDLNERVMKSVEWN